METESEVMFSGELVCIDDSKVSHRAKLCINEFHQGIITLYKVSRELVLLVEENKSEYLVIELESGEKVTVVGLHFKSASGVESNCFILEIQGDILFKGKNAYTNLTTFREINFDITEGNELIGLCPYDLNKNYEDILLYRRIDIPICVEDIVAQLENGEMTFCVYPEYQYSKEAFSIGFRHYIRWKFNLAIDIKQIQENLRIIVDFFSIMAGEEVTVGSLYCVDNKERIEVIGICNFPKKNLNILKNNTIDTTSFKRCALYKITDFQNLEYTLRYWFSNYNKIYNAQQAYRRILLDEEMNIVTINKFLAAMQLIEGYTQAYTDEEKEIQQFEEKKRELINKLENEEEKEMVENGLGFSSISFRKAVRNYLHKGYNCFAEKSKTKLEKEKEKLIKDIVNDRNYYTHSSNRMLPTMTLDELLNIATYCKEIYRIISLKDMGLDIEIIKQRSRANRICYWLMKNILEIEIGTPSMPLAKFDNAMRLFSDSRS